jgi:DNA-binding beta-propeller fold protein YncE
MGKRSCVQTTGLRLGIAAVLAASFPVPVSARVAVDPVIATSQAPRSRVVWVALEGAHKIAKVNLRSREVLKRRSVPGAPHNLTISPSGRTIAAALWSAGSIVVRRNGKQRTVALGGAPHDVKIGGERIVVSNQTEARLDLVTPRGRFRRSIELKADPHDVALRWGGRQAWVTLEGSDDLAVVRIRRPSRVRYVSTGKAPHDLLFAPDGKLWVSDWDGAIHVFSKRGRRLKTIPIGIEAHHLDFTPDGRQVWITDHAAQRIFVVGTKRYRIRKRFNVSGAPHHIAITSDGDRAAVADHENGRVIVYNVNRLRRGKTIRVGSGPHGIWAMP